jgi:hypothetical protein
MHVLGPEADADDAGGQAQDRPALKQLQREWKPYGLPAGKNLADDFVLNDDLQSLSQTSG